ncbi:MAG: nuclear transport factor 2 family protein [Variovorax sp.]
MHDVEIVRDVVYGHGLVGRARDAGPQSRPLKLDLYLPAVDGSGSARPALVMAFGGAFHRGSKENDSFEGGTNTSVSDYCLRFARRGYVACAIDYRLATEDPEPGATRVISSPSSLPTSRVDVVRRILDLPPATPDMLWRSIESASDDMAAAVHFVRHHARDWDVDPARIALGGFSAGARTALNAAFGEKAPVAAVVSLSGFIDAKDLAHHVPKGSGGPATLLVSAENDLAYVRDATPGIARHLRGAGMHCDCVQVLGAGHFYPAEAAALEDRDGARSVATTVEAAMVDFLSRTLAPPVDTAMLEAFADAWNRHDINALMTYMTPDCMFDASFGPDPCGTRYEGSTAVREGFSRTWREYPDAQWRHARHFTAGTRGVSEWTFTGTRASDGVRVEADGMDLFTFEAGRIRIKNSWRKQRP